MKDKFKWLASCYTPALNSYIHLKQYVKAINLTQRYKEVMCFLDDGDQYSLASEDRLLYKLYYLLNYHYKLEAQRKLWREHYRASDNEIGGFEKDVDQGYIQKVNRDNYQIGKNGEIK